MIWHRVLTAIALIAFVVSVLLMANVTTFTLLSAGLFLMGMWEWTGLCEIKAFPLKMLLCGFLGLILWGLMLIAPVDHAYLYGLSFMLWIALMLVTITHRGQVPFLLKNIYSRLGIGLMVLSLGWFGLIQMRLLESGPLWILCLLMIVCSSDTAAYFTGKAFGKRPFSPLISPKKTWAGFWGGFVGAFIVAIVCFWQMGLPQSELPLFVFIAIILILLAIYGDLFESLVKRVADKKDSGTLLPGHGGILDRLDSLLPTLPFFSAYLYWITP